MAFRYANLVTSNPSINGMVYLASRCWPSRGCGCSTISQSARAWTPLRSGSHEVKAIATGADVRTSDVQSFPPTTGPLRGFRGRMEVRSEGYGPHRYPVLTVAYPYVAGRFYARHRTPTGETGAYLGERPGAGFT